jgi:ubiquinone/menaquinone biosynthesis C-methylase UbiE
MTLTSSELKRFYDRFGTKQDAQGFYEDPAFDELVAHAAFEKAERIFEFGCGTGKFAARLLERHAPASATYTCCDVSKTMTELARRRLVPHKDRASVVQSDGAVRFPLPDRSVDRVVCAYVLDLLSEQDIKQAFGEAYRVLAPGGRFCILCLTNGVTPLSRILSSVWNSVFRIRPAWVGGCRPISLMPFADTDRWHVEHRKVVVSFGVPSEVLVLDAKVLLSAK